MKLVQLAFAAATLVAFVSSPLQEEKGRNLKVGDSLPVFRLNDHEGGAVTVGGKSDAWTVVAFYPKALTPG